MASKFQTRISRARFVVSPFSPEQMSQLGSVAIDSVKERLARGQNVSDQPAAPLKSRPRIRKGRVFETYTEINYGADRGYKARKQRKGLPAIRNWVFTGRTLRGMNVLSASENRAVIGFSDPVAGMRAAIQNTRERQFGLSDRNWEDVKGELRQMSVVKVEAA